MTDLLDTTREDEALAIIDRGLALTAGRSLISAEEVADLLLDLRTVLSHPGGIVPPSVS